MIKKFFSALNYIKIYFFRIFIIRENINIKKRFTLFYRYNYWSSKESRSGTGSDLQNTTIIRKKLEEIINKYNVKSLIDLPCGDFYWMRIFMRNKNIKYIGGDIVEELIMDLNNKYENKNISFRQIDLINDKLPAADMLLCRDCFLHFSNKDIIKALKNFIKSDIKFFLVTHTLNETDIENKDILTGEYRFIDLFKNPFYLTRNNLYNFIDPDYNKKLNSKKLVSMWTRDQIENAITNNE